MQGGRGLAPSHAKQIQFERYRAELALKRGGMLKPAASEKMERGIEEAQDVAKVGGRH